MTAETPYGASPRTALRGLMRQGNKETTMTREVQNIQRDLTRNAWQFTSALDGNVTSWVTEAEARRLVRLSPYGGTAEPMVFAAAGDLGAVPHGC